RCIRTLAPWKEACHLPPSLVQSQYTSEQLGATKKAGQIGQRLSNPLEPKSERPNPRQAAARPGHDDPERAGQKPELAAQANRRLPQHNQRVGAATPPALRSHGPLRR